MSASFNLRALKMSVPFSLFGRAVTKPGESGAGCYPTIIMLIKRALFAKIPPARLEQHFGMKTHELPRTTPARPENLSRKVTMQTGRKSRLPTLLLIPLCLILGSCAMTSTGDPGQYNADSWKTLIDADCTAFFDGCNHCRQAESSEVAACTRKACAVYEKPRCLDGANGGAANTNSAVRTVRLQWDEE